MRNPNSVACFMFGHQISEGPDAVVKAACLESRRSRVQTPLWPSSVKKQSVSSPLTREDSIFRGGSVAER